MRKSIASIMWISIVASVLTIGLKWFAFAITGSVGFMSDALESGINNDYISPLLYLHMVDQNK